MSAERRWLALNLGAIAALTLGVIGCAIGAALSSTEFFRAWLCTYLFWIGVPLAGVTLTLTHDLTGGEWMATARPIVDAAILTMPIATLAGIPAFIGLHSLYGWTQPPARLDNAFYLNQVGFFIRYGVYTALWNLLAAFALWGPRGGARTISPRLSWLSGVGLVLLAFSAAFAAIDWILSLEPTFWSAIFPYAASASWFNTGLALVLLLIALLGWRGREGREHMADVSRILLATTILWAYLEFMQFLIIWEENLKSEIPWYLKRVGPDWAPALDISVGLGFVLPFFVLLWSPPKYNRVIVGAIATFILLSRVAEKWWLVLPEYAQPSPIWLNLAALLALGGLIFLPFAWALRHSDRLTRRRAATWTPDHG